MSHLEYRALLDLDIEKSSGRGRGPLTEIRKALSEAAVQSLRRNGIASADCLIIDLGDGLRIVAPAGTPKANLLNTVTQDLAVLLRRHNHAVGSGSPHRIRVRAALHAGEVDVGDNGAVHGPPLEVLARLLEAGELREALRNAPPDTPLALIVSAHYYEDAVKYGSLAVLPEDFEPMNIGVKEYTGQAWLFVPAFAARGPGEGGNEAPGENRGAVVPTEQELEILAAAGATALVTAMATDSWSAVKKLFGLLFRRTGTSRTQAAHDRLDADAHLVEGAKDPEAARRSLLAPWTSELSTLLHASPTAAAELQRLVDERTRHNPPERASQQANQTVVVESGGTANTVGFGNVIHYGIPAPPPPLPSTPELSEESGESGTVGKPVIREHGED